MPTFADLLDTRLAGDSSQPFLTFYDDATGERTELSLRTYANWVNKTANLLVDELLLDPGDTIRIALPPHWLGAVFTGAAWLTGLTITEEPPCDLIVVGPDGLTETAPTVLACSLTPFAARFTEPLPAGVVDYGLAWPGQPDVFVPLDATTPEQVTPINDRVLTDLAITTSTGRNLLLGALAGRGSLVQVANSTTASWPAHYESERATATVRSAD